MRFKVHSDTSWTSWLTEETTVVHQFLLDAASSLIDAWSLCDSLHQSSLLQTAERVKSKRRQSRVFTREGHLIILSHKLFYLGRRVAPTWPQWGCDY